MRNRFYFIYLIVFFCSIFGFALPVIGFVDYPLGKDASVDISQISCDDAKFTWSEGYGTESNPYIKKIGEELNLTLTVDKNDNRWYVKFEFGAPYNAAPNTDYYIIKQEPVPWTQGSNSGNDYNGEANLNIKTKTSAGTLTPGSNVFEIPIIATQDLSSMIGDCTHKETKNLYLKILVNCPLMISGLDCDKDLNVCKTKCLAVGDDCEFVGSECKEKGSSTSGPTTPTGPTTPSSAKTDPTTGYLGALPPCAFKGSCRSVNNLTQLIVNFGKGMFAIMGSFAFAFFVYGGFTMIVSMGNAEKQKKGQQILVAAVIGIVIAFSAYMLINFMLEALNVDPTFRGIKANNSQTSGNNSGGVPVVATPSCVAKSDAETKMSALCGGLTEESCNVSELKTKEVCDCYSCSNNACPLTWESAAKYCAPASKQGCTYREKFCEWK